MLDLEVVGLSAASAARVAALLTRRLYFNTLAARGMKPASRSLLVENRRCDLAAA